MKRTLLILLLLSALTLTSCSLSLDDFIHLERESTDGGTNGGNDMNEAAPDVKMTAEITALGEKLTVDVLKSEYTSGVHWVIYADDTPVYDENGKKITISDLKVGDTLEILYSGQVMMSYPPQIAARRITRLS